MMKSKDNINFMKILHFSNGLGAGGKERRLVELLKSFSDDPDITNELILMRKEIYYDEIYELDIKIHYLIRKNKKDLLIFHKLFKLCKIIKPDIIHSWESMPSFYSFLICKILKIKFVNAMINAAPSKISSFGKIGLVSKVTFPFSDAIVSNSKAGLNVFKTPPNRSYCIHNGFDFKRVENLGINKTIRKKFKINTKYVVCMVATFSKLKDYATYIKAANMIFQTRQDITFLCIGGGEDSHYQDMVTPENSNVKFLGKQTDVESIVNIADIGVLTSSIHGEGISNSIMEYMALEKPVIATNCGGNNELIVNDETGFLISNESVQELIERIKYLINNPEVAVQMGASGKKRILNNFNQIDVKPQYMKLYKKVLRK